MDFSVRIVNGTDCSGECDRNGVEEEEKRKKMNNDQTKQDTKGNASHFYTTAFSIVPISEEVFIDFSIIYPILTEIRVDHKVIVMSLSKFKLFATECLNIVRSIEGQGIEINPSDASQTLTKKAWERLQKIKKDEEEALEKARRQDEGTRTYFG